MVGNRRVITAAEGSDKPDRPILYDGHARLDALMFKERGHMHLAEGFKELYGFTPDQIEDVASAKLTSTLKVADSVGGYHLAGIRLEQDETGFIDRIRELVTQEKYEEAEEASKGLLSL